MGVKGSGINLLRGTWRKYPEIVVPCCRSCNNDYMSLVESRVAHAVKTFASFQELSRSDLGLWAAKVLYGLLHLEVRPWDSKTKAWLPASVPDTVLDHLPMTLWLLQGFSKKSILNSGQWPYSILRFHLKSGGPPALNLNYRDSINWPVALAMRVDSVGFIVVFEDFGYTEHWYEKTLHSLVAEKQIHPLQFAEIVAKVFYEAGLVQFNVRYTALHNPASMYLSLLPTIQPSLDPNPQRRARMIAECTGQPLDQVWNKDDPGKTRSLLVGKNGEFPDLPFETGVLYRI